MNNLSLAVSVVFPLFCMMGLGYLLRRAGLFEDAFLRQLNSVCFKVFLPMVLFINIYKSDFDALFSPRLIFYAVGCVLLAFLVLMAVIPLLEKENKNRGVVIQGIFRSNYILFGVPVTASLYGSENTGTTAILLAFVIPLFNLLSILALQLFSDQKAGKLSLLKEILKNPLILGSFAAFFFVLTGLRMPSLMEKTVSDIAGVATPLALIILGGSFQFRGIGKYKKLLALSVIGKLILIPLFFIPLSILVNFRSMELAALMAMFASPTAVSSFTMAQSMNANDELAGQIVVVDSLLSILTIFFWITVLNYYGLL